MAWKVLNTNSTSLQRNLFFIFDFPQNVYSYVCVRELIARAETASTKSPAVPVKIEPSVSDTCPSVLWRCRLGAVRNNLVSLSDNSRRPMFHSLLYYEANGRTPNNLPIPWLRCLMVWYELLS